MSFGWGMVGVGECVCVSLLLGTSVPGNESDLARPLSWPAAGQKNSEHRTCTGRRQADDTDASGGREGEGGLFRPLEIKVWILVRETLKFFGMMEASSGSESLDSEDVSSSELFGRMKSFLSSPSQVELSTVLGESPSEEDVISLSGSVVAWRFLFLGPLPAGLKKTK